MPKAIVAHSTSKGSRASKIIPFTPVRRLLFRFDKSRGGNHQYAQYQRPIRHGKPEPDPVVDTPPEHSATTQNSAHACMALQNEDVAEDAVIITALTTLPFCCHEDLLTMTRAGLIGVAESLNAKLPDVLRISVDRKRTDAAIRNEIEFIVGLRSEKEVPSTPRAKRQGREGGRYVQEVDVNEEMNRTPPTSPTPVSRQARKLRPYGTPGTPRLERLAEEEEEDDRPLKRLKIRTSLRDASDSMDVDMSATPTSIPLRPRPCTLRSRSECGPSPTPRVQRSHSTKLPAATVNNPTTGVEGNRRTSQPALARGMWVPKQKARAVSATATCRLFLSLPEERVTMSSLTSCASTEALPASSDSDKAMGLKSRRNSIEAEDGMAEGMIGMFMSR